MWIEAVLLTDDLDRLVAQFAPMTIELGAGDLLLCDPGPCVLVPDTGVRVICRGKARWPVLGIDLPVTIHALTVLLRPQIAGGDDGGVLVVKLEIESVDLAGVPKMFEHTITEMANKEVVKKEIELSWGFAKTLTHSFRLPESLAPLLSLDLTVLAGRVRIRSDGIGLAVRFESAVKRDGHGVEASRDLHSSSDDIRIAEPARV
jgi:hypothetical protein